MRATIGVGMLCVLGMALATARSVSAEWFGDLYVGGAFTGARDVSNSVGPNLRNVSFDTSGAIGARGGYWFEDFEYVGLALDALHYRPNISAQTVRTDSAVGPMRLSGVDVKVTAIGFDLMLRYRLLRSEGHPHGWLQPYFLVGPLLTLATADDTSNFGPPNGQRARRRAPGSTSGPACSGSCTSTSACSASIGICNLRRPLDSRTRPRCNSTSTRTSS